MRARWRKAESVIALTAYRSPELLELADCLLPIAPFTETSGTFVNCEGRVQSFNGVVRPLGDARPAWKVLRVLGNLLGLAGFDHDSSEAVRARARWRRTSPVALDNALSDSAPTAARRRAVAAPARSSALADVPIYAADPLVRRAVSLQQTRDARRRARAMNGATLARSGSRGGRGGARDAAAVAGGAGEAVLELARCSTTRWPTASCASPPRIRNGRTGGDVRRDFDRQGLIAMQNLLNGVTSWGEGTLGAAWPVVWNLVEDRCAARCR